VRDWLKDLNKARKDAKKTSAETKGVAPSGHCHSSRAVTPACQSPTGPLNA
jgi:hypothetical protein